MRSAAETTKQARPASAFLCALYVLSALSAVYSDAFFARARDFSQSASQKLQTANDTAAYPSTRILTHEFIESLDHPGERGKLRKRGLSQRIGEFLGCTFSTNVVHAVVLHTANLPDNDRLYLLQIYLPFRYPIPPPTIYL